MQIVAVAIALCLSSVVDRVGQRSMEWIRVSKDGSGFETSDSRKRFTPWGFNYDHDEKGTLIEDYWETQWKRIEEDFEEMKRLGANVVRIHLQFGKFMNSPSEANEGQIARLKKLLRLAEKKRIYLDLTGLGCYHKKDVPDWYDKLDEQGRWNAQAVFWVAITKCCAKSPAIFCYDLMNEPVVPGGRKARVDWLGPPFAGKHFVQFISLDAKDRKRSTIARDWIRHLKQAIRKHDHRHLITVGLVPWSLNRPGLTSGFDPKIVGKEMDFLSVHIYPETGKVDEALKTLRGFDVGKPVVIEETFVLKSSVKELEMFLLKSRTHADGWIGFYWGKSPDEYRRSKSLGDKIVLSWLDLFTKLSKNGSMTKDVTKQPPRPVVTCEGSYRGHLQGIALEKGKAIYWSFTSSLVKTDLKGKLLKKIDVKSHHGDLCFHDGKIYVAVNLEKFNDPKGNADSWVYIYAAKNLRFLKKHETQEVVYGAGGIAYRDGRFYVVGGLPNDRKENYIYEYDKEFRFQKKHVVKSGHTHLGIQTAEFANGHFWFGCYGNEMLKVDPSFQMKGKWKFDCAMGIVHLSGERFLLAEGPCDSKTGCRGKIFVGKPDKKTGMKLLRETTISNDE